MMLSRTSALISLVLLFFLTLSARAELVNINKADAAALQQYLTGVGPVKAQAIIKYRDKNGFFKTLEELTQVQGIGEELIRKNRKNLSLKTGLSKGNPESGSANKAETSTSAEQTSSVKKDETIEKIKKKSTN